VRIDYKRAHQETLSHGRRRKGRCAAKGKLTLAARRGVTALEGGAVIEFNSVIAFLVIRSRVVGGYSSPLRAFRQAQDGALTLVFWRGLMSSISLRKNQVFEPPNIRFLNPQESGFPLLTFHPTLWYNICSCALAVLIPDVGGSLYSSSGYVIIEVLVNPMLASASKLHGHRLTGFESIRKPFAELRSAIKKQWFPKSRNPFMPCEIQVGALCPKNTRKEMATAGNGTAGQKPTSRETT
jgi:hypothetical protein